MWLSAKTYVNLSSSWRGHTVDLYQPLVLLLVLANPYREGIPGLWGGPNGHPRGPPGEPAFGQLGLERPQSVELAIPGLYRDASREGPTDWNLEGDHFEHPLRDSFCEFLKICHTVRVYRPFVVLLVLANPYQEGIPALCFPIIFGTPIPGVYRLRRHRTSRTGSAIREA